MPEEHNRIIIDHISDVLLAPTEETKKNLLNDNVKGQIFVVGNSIVDTITEHAEIAAQKSDILMRLKIEPGKYLLLTVHREENVDSKEKLSDLVNTMEKVSSRFSYPIIFPAHPRTLERLSLFDLMGKVNNTSNLRLIEAVGYFDFLQLLSKSLMVLTDSGGIQEESCLLKIPCITLRDNTERPETVKVGANIVASTNHKKVCDAVSYFLTENKNRDWPNPFGSDCTKKIVDVLVSQLQ